MLSHVLRVEIERYHTQVRTKNPFFTNARAGKTRPEAVSRYLANLLYLVRHTPIHLKLARQAAEEQGLRLLAAFFAEKLGEEEGHDRWAESDLKKLSLQFGVEAGDALAPAMVQLVTYLGDLIRREPSLYLAYIFLAEYFTVIAAPELVQDLEHHCGIPRQMMSILVNHVELDKAHVLDDLRIIDRLNAFGRDESFVMVLKTAIRLFDEFFTQIGRESHAS